MIRKLNAPEMTLWSLTAHQIIRNKSKLHKWLAWSQRTLLTLMSRTKQICAFSVYWSVQWAGKVVLMAGRCRLLDVTFMILCSHLAMHGAGWGGDEVVKVQGEGFCKILGGQGKHLKSQKWMGGLHNLVSIK